jgi:hypothetical protein
MDAWYRGVNDNSDERMPTKLRITGHMKQSSQYEWHLLMDAEFNGSSGQTVRNPASCSGGSELELQPSDSLTGLTIFVVFLTHSRQILEKYIKISRDLCLHIFSNLSFTGQTTITSHQYRFKSVIKETNNHALKITTNNLRLVKSTKSLYRPISGINLPPNIK